MEAGDEHRSITHARRRALCALALFGLGAFVGMRLLGGELRGQGTVVLALAGLSVAIAVFARGRLRTGMLTCCVLLLGTGWAMLRLDPDRPGRIGTMIRVMNPDHAPEHRAVPIEVRGVITHPSRIVHRVHGLADPPMWPDASNQAQLEVTALLVHLTGERIEWVESGGSLRLMLASDVRLRAGERVELLGRFSPVGTRRNPGDPDWSMLAAQRGHEGTLIVEHARNISLSERGGVVQRALNAWVRARGVIRDRALRSVGIDETHPSGAPAATRAALLLGERDPGFDEVYARFQRVGVAHVLAISGFHLALVVLMCTLSVRLIGEHPRIETALILVILLGVVVLIPLRPPIVRASLIVAGMVLANRFGRRYDRITVLAWVGLGLLVWRPMDVTSLGYQLSMGVTALLVVLGDVHRQRLMERHMGLHALPQRRTRWRGLRDWCAELLRVHFSCWLVALPIIAYHAGVVGVLAPIASIVLVPAVALMMALGYAQIIIGIVSPELASRTMWLIEAPSAWTLDLMAWFDGFWFSWARLPSVSALWAIVATLVLALIVTRAVRARRAGTALALLVVLAWGVAHPMLQRSGSALRLVMLDVGDGSCLVIQSGADAVLWDCGSLDRRVGDSVARSLRTLGVTRVTGVVVTHDNLDHYNGLPDLAEVYPIPLVSITSRLDGDPSPSWSRVRRDLESRGVVFRTIDAGDTLRVGRSPIEILWPEEPIPDAYDDNDTSVVALIEVRTRSPITPRILLTGDIEGDAMDRILAQHPELPEVFAGGVIELPHHGSARKKAYAFIDWLDPGVILQSTGPTRLDDERWDAQRPGRDWFTTAEGGAIVVEIDQRGAVTSRYWFGDD